MERGSWPAGRAASRGVDVSLRSWRRPLSWSGTPGPLASRLRAEWTSRCARGGGPEDRPTHARTALPRFAREGGLYRGAGLLARWPRDFARSGRLASLVEAARRTAPRCPTYSALRTVPYVQCPTYGALRTVTPRCARGGGPEDRPTLPYVQCPTYSAPRTEPYVQCPTYSDLRTVTYVQ